MPITDSLFLEAETRERPMHVGGLQLYRAPADAGPTYASDLYRQLLAHDEVSTQLRRRPARLGSVGPWRWELDPDVDLEHHVRRSALPRPGRVRELLELVSRLHGTLLHRSRPLWEMHLVEGLADGRFAVYTKIHHALVDGISATRLLTDTLTTDPDARDPRPPWAPRGSTRTARAAGGDDRHDTPTGGPVGAVTSAAGAVAGMVSGAVSGSAEAAKAITGSGSAALRTLWRSFRDQCATVPYQAPRSMLNVPITGARRFAADSYAMERVRVVRKGGDATLNDVYMAMCAGALRRYLLELDALPEQPLVAMVPVALQRSDDDDGGNAVGVVLCNLATHLADPKERFEVVKASMREGKLSLQGLTPAGVLLLSALSFAPIALGPLFRFPALRKPPFNIVISNVPGPREPLWFAGARLDGSYPLSIPFDGQALNITATTYVDSLEVGLTGDRKALPRLQRLLEHLDTSLTELEEVVA